VIEKGYLYLAQPPLYLYRKGKNEIYLKDDKALNDLLIEQGISVIESHTMGDNDLIYLFKLVSYYQLTLNELDKRYSIPELIRYIVENADEINGENFMSKLDRVKEMIGDLGYNILNQVTSQSKIHLYVQTKEGLEEFVLEPQLFSNSHFKESISIHANIKERLTDEFVGKDLIAMLKAIKEQATKGVSIQRYKGLGEMNPEQLWETTMDPQNRVLLKVTIEDFEKASDTFSLFMGDEVEPRRNYIETHAKDVKHLDV